MTSGLLYILACLCVGLCLAYRDTCRASKMEPPLPVPTPVPELRIEKRNGVMWSVATYETGAEVWSIVRRAA
jgi:hypothetical protein